MPSTLSIREDGSEMLRYNTSGLPLKAEGGSLGIFANFAAGCHWHQDFETLVALDAEMDYHVNGVRIHLRQGDAIFVNSRRLHYGYSAEFKECNYKFAVFHSELLGFTPAIVEMIETLTSDESPDYWHVEAGREQDKEILAGINYLCDHADPAFALLLQSNAAAVLDELYHRMEKTPGKHDPNWAIIRDMVGFIQGHYQEKIQIQDIADAGMVCRSRCCQLFREKLGTSPNVYLTRYRLEKACAEMREGKSITEAALDSGFGGTSFFSETFRKFYGMRPTDYMKQARQS